MFIFYLVAKNDGVNGMASEIRKVLSESSSKLKCENRKEYDGTYYLRI